MGSKRCFLQQEKNVLRQKIIFNARKKVISFWKHHMKNNVKTCDMWGFFCIFVLFSNFNVYKMKYILTFFYVSQGRT